MLRVFLFFSFFFINKFFFGNITTSADNTCNNSSIIVTDEGTYSSIIAYRIFDFGDGQLVHSTTNIQPHQYNTAGTYNISVLVKFVDSTSSNILYPNNIVVNNAPISNFTADKYTTCINSAINFIPNPTNGDGVITNYILDFGDNTSNTLFNTNSSHSYTYISTFTPKFIVIDNNGCTDTFSQSINITSIQAPSFNISNVLCKDSIVYYQNTTNNLNNVNYSWNWLIEDNSNQFNSFSINTQQQYATYGLKKVTLTLTDNLLGCSSSFSTIHIIDTNPQINIIPSIDTFICYNDKIEYTVNSSEKVWIDDSLWLSKISEDTLFIVYPENTYTYRVYSKSNNCPKVFKDINIKVLPKLETNVSAIPKEIITGTKSIININIDGIYDSLRWSPDSNLSCNNCDSFTVSPDKDRLYFVNVFYSLSGLNCSVQDSIMINVVQNCDVSKIILPNAFTPYDNKNNVFYLNNIYVRDLKKFAIYNRWGNEVFLKTDFPPNDINYGWNGKLNNSGEELQEGIYYYKIKGLCSNNEEFDLNGEILLIR